MGSVREVEERVQRMWNGTGVVEEIELCKWKNILSGKEDIPRVKGTKSITYMPDDLLMVTWIYLFLTLLDIFTSQLFE